MSEPTANQATGVLIGLDLGLARIGVAVSDGLGLAAHPRSALVRRSRREDFAQLADLVTAAEAVAVICGLPLLPDGEEGQQARMTRKWGERLAHALRTLCGRPVPVIFWDERFSTYVANEVLATLQSDVAEDAAAAAVILQSYLDARRHNQVQDFGRIHLPPRPVDGESIQSSEPGCH